MAGLAWCSGSWMVGGPLGTVRMSPAGEVLMTLWVSWVCFEQIFPALSLPCPFYSFSRSEHPGSAGKLEVRDDGRPIYYRRMLAGEGTGA